MCCPLCFYNLCSLLLLYSRALTFGLFFSCGGLAQAITELEHPGEELITLVSCYLTTSYLSLHSISAILSCGHVLTLALLGKQSILTTISSLLSLSGRVLPLQKFFNLIVTFNPSLFIPSVFSWFQLFLWVSWDSKVLQEKHAFRNTTLMCLHYLSEKIENLDFLSWYPSEVYKVHLKYCACM